MPHRQTKPQRLPALSSPIEFGREVCGDLSAAEQREWLVTNGLGSFASGTVAGLLTRRYHGLLVAALKPPLGRTLLAVKLEETASYDGQTYPLFVNRWADGALNPLGYRYIERFRLEGTTPVWRFACAVALLEKRIWMEQGADTTYVRYALLRACRPLQLQLKALVNYRDYHGSTHAGEWLFQVAPVAGGLRVSAFAGAVPYYLLSDSATVKPGHSWYRNFELARERERGYDNREDHLHAGTFTARLEAGDSVTIALSCEATPDLDGRSAYARRRAHERTLLKRWMSAHPRLANEAPAWVQQLVLAADQFIVNRQLPDGSHGYSIIAGYPWFGDWGRDTMVALPGLTLATGRPEIAGKILRTFSHFVDRGMLPNFFPDTDNKPEYNTVDATLWYFLAVRQYFRATRDVKLLRELFPVLEDIVAWHVRGTRYKIHLDPADGLLYAGEPGVELTWMDAKVGGSAVTPRIGKPVEVNALWYNALLTMAQFARALRKSEHQYEFMARQAGASCQQFWNEATGYCYDVLDGPEGNDATLRPNQIFAVCLPESPLTAKQQRAVVDTCGRHLLTAHGLRSLAPNHPAYHGHYGGNQQQRDAAYHQGTVWGWLLGPFVLAHLRVYVNPARAAFFLAGMADHLAAHGLGSLSEIFDGDAPFAACGCVAQAWTVAEVLRAWLATAVARAKLKTRPSEKKAKRRV